MIVQEGPEEVILGLLLWSQREFSLIHSDSGVVRMSLHLPLLCEGSLNMDSPFLQTWR